MPSPAEAIDARETWIARWVPLCCALAALALLVSPAFPSDVQFFYRDTGRLFYPTKKFIAEQLRAGHLPLWNPWTESGTSLLAQMPTGLLHPFTLLYAVLPFDAAFKLNHLLTIPLAAIGAYLLARRIGASRWAAAATGVTYGGCGFLVSELSGNLCYALGPASVPLAVEGILRFADEPSARRLLWAGVALSLCAYAGDPQSMLFAGLIGGGWLATRAAMRTGLRGAARAAGLCAAAGAVALLLSAPVVLPAWHRLRDLKRLAGVSAAERSMFLVAPARLAGLMVPRAFDDQTEVYWGDAQRAGNPFREYFSIEASGAFADSIVLGAAAVLLAGLGAAQGRRGRFLLAGGLLFAIASTGTALGVQDALMSVVPGLKLFRYAEKFIAPASLLFALLAALGFDAAFRSDRAPALAVCGAAAALITGVAALLLARNAAAFQEWMRLRGASHQPEAAARFVAELRSGLWIVSGTSAALALAAALRRTRLGHFAPGLALLCCASSTFASSAGLVVVAPLEVLHGPFVIAEELVLRAGASPGRWRLYTNTEGKWVPVMDELGERLASAAGLSQSLIPQYQSLAGIEGASQYFAAPDHRYASAMMKEPFKLWAVLGVQFVLFTPYEMTRQRAQQMGFTRLPHGYWLREFPQRPRAFLVDGVRTAPPGEALQALSSPDFNPLEQVLLIDADAERLGRPASRGSRRAGTAAWERIGPEEQRISVEAVNDAVLVVAEHYDAGWRATVDGAPAPVARADEAVLGVPVPKGRHEVRLRFVPPGLGVGLWAATFAVVALTLADIARRRSPSGK